MSYSYKIEQAIRAAAVLHKDQVRRGLVPIPYVAHLYAVATLISDYTEDEDTIVAALLHDTIEDTDYTPRELENDFGRNVADIVLGVTETENTEGADWATRKRKYLKQLKGAPEASLIVSAADKIHNMRNLIEEYYDAHARFMKDFGGTLEERVRVYQEISNILNRRLKNPILSEFNHVFEEYKKFIHHVQTKQS
ncbi:HD domain-containing protein [Candidatus Kaiserbacteria bacterium]|nr:HD domain-containing protein [Candidatus Kaiserbacteria bacterium]